MDHTCLQTVNDFFVTLIVYNSGWNFFSLLHLQNCWLKNNSGIFFWFYEFSSLTSFIKYFCQVIWKYSTLLRNEYFNKEVEPQMFGYFSGKNQGFSTFTISIILFYLLYAMRVIAALLLIDQSFKLYDIAGFFKYTILMFKFISSVIECAIDKICPDWFIATIRFFMSSHWLKTTSVIK